jgi:ABC-type multidrug transport system ATPase subunit
MIELSDVIKEYSGPLLGPRRRVRALDGVSLRVGAGEAVGVVGLNGAGKSTLLRVLLGYVRPTSGRAEIGGLRPREYAERHGVSYLPERVAIPRGWTVRGALWAYAMLDHLAEEEARERVEAAMERLGIAALADRRVGALSKGNVQRLAIAQLLLARRKLTVLDEPTDGLDPVWIAQLREIVAEWRAADPERTLLLASHNLPEVERLTERVVILHAGRVFEETETGHESLEARFLRLAAAWEEAA